MGQACYGKAWLGRLSLGWVWPCRARLGKGLYSLGTAEPGTALLGLVRRVRERAVFSARRSDGRAEWRVLADLVTPSGLTPGTVWTHRQLLNALETNDVTRMYRAVIRLNEFLLREHGRCLSNVRGVGYRVLAANEHPLEAGRHQRRASRAVDRSVNVMRSTRLDELTPEERMRVVAATNNAVALQSAIDHRTRTRRRAAKAVSSALRKATGIQPPAA